MIEDMATRLGLTLRHYKMVTDLLTQHVADRPVWAFGCRTFGRARRYSDLDLAVGGDSPLSAAQEYELIDAFDDSMLPIEVDVIDLHDVDATFRSRIEPDFLLIHGQDQVKR